MESLFCPALGANAKNLHAMSEYVIIAPIIGVPPRKVKGRPVDVIDPTATHTTQMVVAGDVAIETGLGAREFQLSNRRRSAPTVRDCGKPCPN